MKRFLVLVFFLSCVLVALGQPKSVNPIAGQSEFLVRKHIACDDLERQAKDIPFVTVRVFARYKLASWLWKDGKDDTGRAEQIAVAAIDDLYENKAEVPEFYFDQLSSWVLALLDRNAKKSADKFREKYKITPENDSSLFGPSLDQPGGDKIAVDWAIRSLVNQSETNISLVLLMGELQRRGSRELFRLLSAVIQAEETGQTRFTTVMLNFMSGYFVGNDVPDELQKRFLRLVVNKAKSAAQTPGGDIDGFFNLLSPLMPVIAAEYQELQPEAVLTYMTLKTQASRKSRENQERKERIRVSADSLNAMVLEAEQAEDRDTKYDLYAAAAQLALRQKKFNYSIELAGKAAEIEVAYNVLDQKRRKQVFDQFLEDVVVEALKADEPDAAQYATKQISGALPKADSHKRIALYLFDHGDTVSAQTNLDQAIKLIREAESVNRRTQRLISIIPAAQKIDPNVVSVLGELTAKSINSIPSLNTDDKPQTENFKNYVMTVMAINENLLPVMTKLVKENKIEATSLAAKINKKEIKIIADLVLLTDAIPSLPEPKTGKRKSS